jgi:hypothetical protein
VSDTYHIGIDPGWSGGIAIVFRGVVVEVHNMPDGPLSLWLLLSRIKEERRTRDNKPVRACLEKVSGYIGNEGDPGASMFTFGRNYGAVELALCALGIPTVNPTANVWQRKVGAPIKEKGETGPEHKRKLKELAQQIFPDAAPTLKTCDAMLLGYYSSLL